MENIFLKLCLTLGIIWFNMLSTKNLFAQDLILSLGGQPTQFELYSDTVNLEPIAQTIIKRAERFSDKEYLLEMSVGYAYESFHLEFISHKPLEEQFYYVKFNENKDYLLELSFFSADDSLFHQHQISIKDLDVHYDKTKKQGLYIYSINLIDIPLVLFDQAQKINMVKKLGKRGSVNRGN